MATGDRTIEVCIAGPGFGEAVLVIIGGKFVIGIDSCVSFVQRGPSGKTFLDEKLEKLDEQSTFFWILTHFHSDHFQSFSSILNQFGDKLKSVFVPLDYTNADITLNLAAHEAKVSGDSDAAYHLARGEYKRIRRLLDSDDLQHLYIAGVGKQTLFNAQLELADGSLIPLEVTVHGLQRSMLNDVLGREIPLAVSAKTGTAGSRMAANEGSYIIHVRCGKFEGLFLGDAPSARTMNVLSLRKVCDSEVLVLKVAHHGSDDGTSVSLLRSLCETTTSSGENRRYALIAPFRSNGLPQKKTIELLKEHSFDIRVSGGKNSEDERNRISKDYELATNVSINEATGPRNDIVTLRVTDF